MTWSTAPTNISGREPRKTMDQRAMGCFNTYMTWSTAPTNIFRPLTWCFNKYMTCLTETHGIVSRLGCGAYSLLDLKGVCPVRKDIERRTREPWGEGPNKHPARPAFMLIRAWFILCAMQDSSEKQWRLQLVSKQTHHRNYSLSGFPSGTAALSPSGMDASGL